MTPEQIKTQTEISSRLKDIKEDDLKVVDFIIDYSFKDSKEVYTNGTILVPLFRVLDAISQKGQPYQTQGKMKTKLIKVDGYWIVVSDKEPNKGDVAQHPNGSIGLLDTALAIALFKETNEGSYVEDCKKVLFSQNPSHNLHTITFSDEVAKKLGINNFSGEIAMLALSTSTKIIKFLNENGGEDIRLGELIVDLDKMFLELISKYKKVSDNADKKFTLEDVRKAIELAREGNLGYYTPDSPNYYFEKTENEIIQSLTKQEYFCEFEHKQNSILITKIWK